MKKIRTLNIESRALGLALEVKKTNGLQYSLPSTKESRLELIQRDTDPSKVVDILVKDHKQLDEDGPPSGRPICGASSTINGEASWYVADILNDLSASGQTDEVISSEKLMEEVQNICIGSVDVKALYFS